VVYQTTAFLSPHAGFLINVVRDPRPNPVVFGRVRCGLKLPQMIVVIEHCNSRECRNGAERVQMVWRSSSALSMSILDPC
jgi:hypothetical protein